MSTTVFRDIGKTLKKLLKDIPGLSGMSSIEFKSPADMESEPASLQMSIFLYQAIANTHLRNVPPMPVNLDKMQYPPLTVDLHYIVTPYAQDKEAELLAMEGIMQIFHDNAVLKGDLLQGNLEDTGNTEIRIVPNPLSLDDLNKLWSTFPNKPFKPSASYILTPVRIPSAKPLEVIKRVVETEVTVAPKKKVATDEE